MRYPDGGGLIASGRARRVQVRLRAAALFEQGITPVQVAEALHVSTKSAYQWRRRRRSGGTAALGSTGPGGNPCRLSPAQQTCGIWSDDRASGNIASGCQPRSRPAASAETDDRAGKGVEAFHDFKASFARHQLGQGTRDL